MTDFLFRKSLWLTAIFFLVSIHGFCSSKDELRKNIESVLNSLPSSTHAAILIYNPLKQDTIYKTNICEPMIPASCTKLFTTATALSLLGGDFHISTKIFTDDNNIKDNVINGNLYIKGYGNSTFNESELDSLAQYIAGLGIKKITGDVIGDDYYFDEIYDRDDWINDENTNVRLPPISALVLNRNKKFIFKKHRRRLRRYTINIENPPLYVAQKLYDELKRNNIIIQGEALKGTTPGNVLPLAESSISLGRLIKLINKHSDNFMAECLFKTLGAEISKKQGNSFYSTKTILEFIQDNEIYNKGTEVVDGSGLSRFDKVTAAAFGGLLEKMYFDLPHFEDFYNSLSIAGVDGTLRHRMMGTAAQNNFHGKTGTLNGVSSVCGYLKNKKGEDIIVIMLFEFERGGASLHRRIQDKIIEELCED